MTYQPQKASLLTLYKASAGSGKTFMLAVRYIALLVQNPESYRNILAVTFTNKATGEMKQRILGQLYGISHRLKESEIYLQEIKKIINTDATDDELRINAGKALGKLLQDYGHFRVETIDSFFQTILRNLAKELQLGANQSLELDTDAVIEEAVASFLSNLSSNSLEIKLIIRFIEEKIQDENDWKIDSELKSFASQLFREVFIEKGDRLRDILKFPDKIIEYKSLLTDEREKKLNNLAEKIRELGQDISYGMYNNGLNDSHLDRNANSLIKSIGDDSFFDKIGKSTIDNCLEDPAKFFNKKTRENSPELVCFAADFMVPRLQRAKELGSEYVYINNSYSAALDYLYELSLLLDIRKEIDNLNAEQGRFILADTCNLLSKLEDGDTSFVFEKTGSFTRHIMIDEFQDTSKLQWQNLRILLMECLAQGNESLVVGDVKQSIYRWRNSDWNILNTEIESDLRMFSPKIINLTTNRRSYYNIIDFNNCFFSIASKVCSDYCVDNIGDSFPSLGIAYSDVVQECPSDERKGYVKVSMHLANDDAKDYMLKQVAAEVIHLDEMGVRQSDITILTRGKKEIAQIANYFAANHPQYKMISNEAFTLEASDAVRILIDALSVLGDSSDGVAPVDLALLWNRTVRKTDIHIEDITAESVRDFLPKDFNEGMDILQQMPLYELVERLYNIFEIEKVDGQDDYIFTLLDSIANYLKNHPNSINDFIDFWNEKLHSATIPTVSFDGIRLMTIHKSKGLEFHTVILPYCDWQFILNNKSSQLWVEPQEAPFNELPLLPVGFNLKLKNSVFSGDYSNEYGQVMVDNLNILYVAFTRARCNLIVMGQKKKQFGADKIITSSLSDCGAFGLKKNDDEEIVFENGEIVPHIESVVRISDNPFEQKSENIMVRMQSFGIRTHFKQSNQSIRFIHSEDEDTDYEVREEYIRTGNLFHQLFSTIRTVDDIDREVEKLLFQGVISDRETAEKIGKMIHKAVSAPPASDWFSGKYKLYNETSILFRNGSSIQSRRPDRVMTDEDKTIVVDFKFGIEKEDYLYQVKEYMDLLRRMGRKNVCGYIWYVYENKIIEC